MPTKAGLDLPPGSSNQTRPAFNALAVASSMGLNYVPVPSSFTDCGLPLALSAIVSDSFSAPVLVGLKVTLKVQLAPAATLVPQVLV